MPDKVAETVELRPGRGFNVHDALGIRLGAQGLAGCRDPPMSETVLANLRMSNFPTAVQMTMPESKNSSQTAFLYA